MVWQPIANLIFTPDSGASVVENKILQPSTTLTSGDIVSASVQAVSYPLQFQVDFPSVNTFGTDNNWKAILTDGAGKSVTCLIVGSTCSVFENTQEFGIVCGDETITLTVDIDAIGNVDVHVINTNGTFRLFKTIQGYFSTEQKDITSTVQFTYPSGNNQLNLSSVQITQPVTGTPQTYAFAYTSGPINIPASIDSYTYTRITNPINTSTTTLCTFRDVTITPLTGTDYLTLFLLEPRDTYDSPIFAYAIVFSGAFAKLYNQSTLIQSVPFTSGTSCSILVMSNGHVQFRIGSITVNAINLNTASMLYMGIYTPLGTLHPDIYLSTMLTEVDTGGPTGTTGGTGSTGGAGNSGATGYNNMSFTGPAAYATGSTGTTSGFDVTGPALMEFNYTGYTGSVRQTNTITVLGEEGGTINADEKLTLHVTTDELSQILAYRGNWSVVSGDASGEQTHPEVKFLPVLACGTKLNEMYDILATGGTGAQNSNGRKWKDSNGDLHDCFGNVMLGLTFTNSWLDDDEMPRESIREIAEGLLTRPDYLAKDVTGAETTVVRDLSTTGPNAVGSAEAALLKGLFEQAVAYNRIQGTGPMGSQGAPAHADATLSAEGWKQAVFQDGDSLSFLAKFSFQKSRDYKIDSDVSGGGTAAPQRKYIVVAGKTYEIISQDEVSDIKDWTYEIKLIAKDSPVSPTGTV